MGLDPGSDLQFLQFQAQPRVARYLGGWGVETRIPKTPHHPDLPV